MKPRTTRTPATSIDPFVDDVVRFGPHDCRVRKQVRAAARRGDGEFVRMAMAAIVLGKAGRTAARQRVGR